ncbi:MAG: hypothetical protein IPM66_06085 [Acidobacteriota bacterium]|nr:MAG: hypothetical protein IPM66_06085 [Acidobacteriota bacterium]
MNLDQFESSLASDAPPAVASPYLTALWHEKKGDWKRAHEIVQEIEDERAALVHAYLHRREGDEDNARYWYRRARKSFPAGVSLDQEWQDLVADLLA